jgi:S-formylglutathione hydrolase FrmB
MNVILPQKTMSQIGMEGKADKEKYPVLYLLHGLSDDHTIWCRRTSIERYVAPLGLAVVMPNVHRSFYADMAQGGKYWTFVSEELPQIVKSFFPVSDKREDTFVAGLSMGGYGAFKLGLSLPGKFAAAASLSGVLDSSAFARDEARQEEFIRIFGPLDGIEGSENDLFHLASKLSEDGAKMPKLYQCCGAEDFLYDANIKFRDFSRKLNMDLLYEECPGTHEWGFWDKMIQNVLKWLPLS